MPDTLSPLEAAEILEDIAAVSDLKAVDGARSGLVNLSKNDASSLRAIASMLRKIASGEYTSVVHAHWEQKDCSKWPICSNCGKPTLSRGYCPAHSNYCPSCGALMDGKDDSHE